MALSEGTQRALAAALHEAGYALVARALAEGGGQFETVHGTPENAAELLASAAARANVTGAAQMLVIVPQFDEYRPPELMPTFPSRATHGVVSRCPGCGAPFGRMMGVIATDEVACDRCGESWVADSIVDGEVDWRRADGVRAAAPELGP